MKIFYRALGACMSLAGARGLMSFDSLENFDDLDLYTELEESSATRTCAVQINPPTLFLPQTEGTVGQVVGLVDNNGTLSWITTITSPAQAAFLLSATSADIPLTLVLRDSTGSFFSTTVTLTGCLVVTDSLNNAAGKVCGNTRALIIAPQGTRALQTTARGNARGTNAIDLQIINNGTTQVASGNYSAILSGTGNTAAGFFATIIGGYNNIANGAGAFVGGGGVDGTVFGGNMALGAASVVGGGINNTAGGSYSGILSGSGNTSSGNFSTIIGGINNKASGAGSVIGGGGTDGTRYGPNVAAGAASFIGGGLGNTLDINSPYSGIVSGSGNQILTSSFSIIGGGQSNNINSLAHYAVIGGGQTNMVNATYGAILGGVTNTVTGTGSVILGGSTNTLAAIAGFIGAGSNNQISAAASYSAIASGTTNLILAPYCVIGAGQTNTISANADHSVIGGGANNLISANYAAILGGQSHTITGTGSVIVGGGFDGASIGGNTINAAAAFVGAGLSNKINASGNYSAIVTGSGNMISAPYSIICSGQTNTISSGADHAVIGGGINNMTSGSYSAVFSGQGNTTSGICAVVCGGGFDGTTSAGNSAAGNASFIGSGLGNSIAAGAAYAAILGGVSNTITGSSLYSVIAGGNSNQIKNASNAFAAGTNAVVTSTGAFVWADSTLATFTDNGVNSFNVRCSGGAYFWSTASGSAGPGVILSPGGGSWTNASDVNLKMNIFPVDTLTTLQTLCTLTTYTWSFIAQGPSITHIGPMAQDLYNAFGYGEDPCYIGTSDAIGLLTASVQALYQLYQAQQPTRGIFDEQQACIDELEQRIKRLEDMIERA